MPRLEHNVQSTKLDVLLTAEAGDDGDLEASKEGDSKVDDDDLVASNEDGFDINSLFPFTLQFLDLSTLGLEEEVPGRLPCHFSFVKNTIIFGADQETASMQ